MSWQERMGPASFRGVPFYVETAERSGGRRGVTHEYPFRDEPFREDLGRQAQGFALEGYVIGNEYLEARDTLLAALQEYGPGQLVHPYYGTIQVAVISFRFRDGRNEGGMARVSIEFQETPAAPSQPKAVPDAPSKLRASAATARSAVSIQFLGDYSPGIHMESIAQALGMAAEAAEAGLATAETDVQALAAMHRQVSALAGNAQALVEDGAELVSGLLELFEAFKVEGFDSLLELYSFDSGTRPTAATSNRQLEQENFDKFHHFTQRAILIRAAELVGEVSFTNHEQAVAARDLMTALLDEQMEAVNDDAYPALQQLRADVVQAVPNSEAALPRLLSYTPPETLPSLVLAYRLYGDVAREEDLIARNHIPHPGFVVGGQGLEVLADG